MVVLSLCLASGRQVVATYCGLKAFKWDSDSANVPDDWKPAAPFEQLPVATFGQHVRIAHSMAIVRFIARKMGSCPST
jgi:hypothetical protein